MEELRLEEEECIVEKDDLSEEEEGKSSGRLRGDADEEEEPEFVVLGFE